MKEVSVFWFRRDLRINDNTGLYNALKGKYPVLPLFIFDTTILEALSVKTDLRVTFIYQQLQLLSAAFKKEHSDILIRYGTPEEVWKELLQTHAIKEVYTNHDYEPKAIARDEKVKHILEQQGVLFSTFKDHVIFEKEEIKSGTGSPYKVYTPYKNKWLQTLETSPIKSYPSENHLTNLWKIESLSHPSLHDIGFEEAKIDFPSSSITNGIIKSYAEKRDFPALDATSKLGLHLRFGTISIREKAKKAKSLSEVWLSELIWRDFFIQLMYHFPYVVSKPFQSKFEKVTWRYDEADFKCWCEGKTGYPLVDAGMRELNETGYMHNRVRMVVASFLAKHLLIDWRMGEAYFAEKLHDFELASNNGNWQWCAGTGADAQPYFRIFNPTAQQQKFDPEFVYIKKWVPEFGTASYPAPMIDHKVAVARTKKAFDVLKM